MANNKMPLRNTEKKKKRKVEEGRGEGCVEILSNSIWKKISTADMFQLVCQQAEKGQHLPEGDAAHCSCCSPAVRVLLLLSTVRSTKENNSCFIYTYICELVCVCCPFCACNFSFVANSNRFLSAALGALSSFRTTGHGHFSPPPHLSLPLSLLPRSFKLVSARRKDNVWYTQFKCKYQLISQTTRLQLRNYVRENCVCLRGEERERQWEREGGVEERGGSKLRVEVPRQAFAICMTTCNLQTRSSQRLPSVCVLVCGSVRVQHLHEF